MFHVRAAYILIIHLGIWLGGATSDSLCNTMCWSDYSRLHHFHLAHYLKKSAMSSIYLSGSSKNGVWEEFSIVIHLTILIPSKNGLTTKSWEMSSLPLIINVGTRTEWRRSMIDQSFTILVNIIGELCNVSRTHIAGYWRFGSFVHCNITFRTENLVQGIDIFFGEWFHQTPVPTMKLK